MKLYMVFNILIKFDLSSINIRIYIYNQRDVFMHPSYSIWTYVAMILAHGIHVLIDIFVMEFVVRLKLKLESKGKGWGLYVIRYPYVFNFPPTNSK